ncbi:asparaginase [Candidatus Gracilibacteria bacterium]|nr:asparaginase [Candidatus Gracilibacteria bacterium]
MKRVVVITTGGTIATRRGPMVGGSVPTLKGEELLALLPRDGIDLAFEEFSNLPSSHLTPANALELSQKVEAVLLSPDVDGVVITHGSDTLEETAYLLDLTLKAGKPVVITGAMRTAASSGYDGVVNLANAIRVAAAAESRDLGTLVVFDEEIHAAAAVQMLFTQARRAFASPDSGPLGRIEGQRIVWHQRPINRLYIPCVHLELMVDLLRLSQGADQRQLRHSIDDGAAGIVIETFGSGRVPPWWIPLISEAISRRSTVVITSRCLVGGLGDEYGYVGAYHDLQRLGVLFANHLSGPKARIKLMVALGAARSVRDLKAWFTA